MGCVGGQVNGIVLNNVNACGGNTALLTPPHLTHISTTLYPIFSRWALTVYITPCYAAPMSEGMGLPKLDGVDPLDPKVHTTNQICFFSPESIFLLTRHGGCVWSGSLCAQVAAWWSAKVGAIHKLMPSFGGFLVKADSEGNQGPIGYNRTEADGANLLARVR